MAGSDDGRSDAGAGTPVIDTDALLANLGGDRGLAEQLLGQLGRDVGERAAQLRDALDGGSVDEVHRIAHALKGALASGCALRARDCVQSVDDAARQGDLEGARAMYPRAEEALVELQSALDEPQVPPSGG